MKWHSWNVNLISQECHEWTRSVDGICRHVSPLIHECARSLGERPTAPGSFLSALESFRRVSQRIRRACWSLPNASESIPRTRKFFRLLSEDFGELSEGLSSRKALRDLADELQEVIHERDWRRDGLHSINGMLGSLPGKAIRREDMFTTQYVDVATQRWYSGFQALVNADCRGNADILCEGSAPMFIPATTVEYNLVHRTPS